VYQLHWPDPKTPIEETLETMESLKAAGKIRYIGVSNFSVGLTQQAMQIGTIATYQGLYNMLERNAESYHTIPLTYKVEKEILPFCQQHSMAFFPYSPLFQGLLTGTFQPSGNFDDHDMRTNNPKLQGERFQTYFDMVTQLQDFARKIRKPLSQIAINWLIKHDAVTSVICGAQNIQHVEENVASVEWELTDAMMTEIEEILQPYHL
jgi:aryl-alcohol dehydrogenase-like predicted oxidoreductase